MIRALDDEFDLGMDSGDGFDIDMEENNEDSDNTKVEKVVPEAKNKDRKDARNNQERGEGPRETENGKGAEEKVNTQFIKSLLLEQ